MRFPHFNMDMLMTIVATAEKKSVQVSQCRAWMLRQLRQRVQQASLGVAAINHHDPENLDGVQPVCLCREKIRALFHGCTHQRVFIFCVRYLWTVVTKENLVQPGLFIKRAQSSFEALYNIVPPGVV